MENKIPAFNGNRQNGSKNINKLISLGFTNRFSFKGGDNDCIYYGDGDGYIRYVRYTPEIKQLWDSGCFYDVNSKKIEDLQTKPSINDLIQQYGDFFIDIDLNKIDIEKYLSYNNEIKEVQMFQLNMFQRFMKELKRIEELKIDESPKSVKDKYEIE